MSNVNVNPYTNEGFFDTLKPRTTNTLTLGTTNTIVSIPGTLLAAKEQNTTFSFLHRKTTTSQTLTSGTTLNVQFITPVLTTNDPGLTYSAGIFTNNTGSTLLLNVNAFWSMDNNLSGTPGTNKESQIYHSTLGRVAYNNSPTIYMQTLNLSSTFPLANGENFVCSTYQSSNQTINISGSSIFITLLN